MSKKQGDLRLLKDGVVFGPTDRAGLDRLLAAGRLTLADHVSVANASWVPIAEYLAGGAAKPPPRADAVDPAPIRPRKKGDLRIVNGGRIIGSLSREDVDQLWGENRLDVDDLICAVGGPWMRVGDFMAQTAGGFRVRGSGFSDSPEAEPVPAVADPVWTMPTASVVPPPALPVVSAVAPPADFVPPLIDPVVVPQAVAAPAGYGLVRQRPPSPNARDEWYVRVRGIHSAPLKKQHVKALYQAREVTLDCFARHPTWHDTDWRPIHSIPELADITRP